LKRYGGGGGEEKNGWRIKKTNLNRAFTRKRLFESDEENAGNRTANGLARRGRR